MFLEAGLALKLIVRGDDICRNISCSFFGMRKFANAFNPEEKSMGHQCRNIPN